MKNFRFALNAWARTLLLTLIGVLSTPTFAQAVWPSKPVKIIVPYAPGGANDILARVDRKSTRLNSSHIPLSRMPSSA